MSILPSNIPQNKLHYVYSLAYPTSMGGHVFYIGKGSGRRIDDHEKQAHNPKNSGYKVNIIRKIERAGERIVKTKIAFFATHDEATQYEVALIFLMRGYEHLANLTDGGDGAVGAVRSEEYRDKIRTLKVGVKREPFSEEWRQNLGLSRKGKKTGSRSLEARNRMSQAQKASPHKQEYLRQQSERRRRGELTEKELEHLQQMNEANKLRRQV